MASEFVVTPPAAVSIPVVGQSGRFPVRRVYCVGRNYEDHAKEMGFTGREPPFFFMKAADAVRFVGDGETGSMAYPTLTRTCTTRSSWSPPSAPVARTSPPPMRTSTSTAMRSAST